MNLMGDPADISVLEPSNVNMSSFMIELTLRDPALCNLREIKLSMLAYPDDSWKIYNYSTLSELLVARYPDLQVFECTSAERGTWELGFSRAFGSFKPLTKLHTLRLDLNLLLDEALNIPFDHEAMLPPNLKHLTLTFNAYALNNTKVHFENEAAEEALRAP